MPRTQRDWANFIRVLADATLRNRSGRIYDESVLSQSVVGNRQSVQNIIPVTAVDTGSDITINVAAHTNNYDFGAVSYNSGSITGLNYNTRYFVYADDAGFAGGAVTYLASTDPVTMTAAQGRYYVGSVTTQDANVTRVNFVGYAPVITVSGGSVTTDPVAPPVTGGGGGGAGAGGEAPGDGEQWP